MKANKKHLLAKFQNYIAHTSVGPSTIRGQKRGTKEIVINYLKKLNLGKLSKINDEKDFTDWLNHHTNTLAEKLRKNWGVARKAINLFLFHASHNLYLQQGYRLRKIIKYLELPLDNYNAKRLKEYAREKQITLKWKSIKSLTRKENKKFQEIAREYAKEKGMYRCHLDLIFWVEGKERKK
jgi:hypothetical protein